VTLSALRGRMRPSFPQGFTERKRTKKERMKDCYYDLGLHSILLDDPPQSYILNLRDRGTSR
jgi:hypothetical protein